MRLYLALTGIFVELPRHEVLVSVQIFVQVDNLVDVDRVRPALHRSLRELFLGASI